MDDKADRTTKAGADDPGVPPADAPLGWPLVDRRLRLDGASPVGVDRRQRPPASRLDQLAEANQLLVALHQVAQSLPSSLDLDGVLDAMVDQVRSLIGGDVVTILLRDPEDGSFVPVRGRGSATGTPIDPLPDAVRSVLGATEARLVHDLAGGGLAADAAAGIYVSADSRHHTVAVVACETRGSQAFTDDERVLLSMLAEPFAVAVDNARLFRRLRTMAADEERRRLARDVHDRIGSSVALLGFEVDRILAETNRGLDPGDSLRGLRGQITTVVGEVRETLNDLRTEVTDERDLATILGGFLDRLAARSGLTTHLTVSMTEPLPLPQERELWRMALEALVNVERHSGATTVWVDWSADDAVAELTIRDDGKGLQFDAIRADSYGLTGMRERATAIGARVQVTGGPEAGTTVTIRIGPYMDDDTQTATRRTA